MSVSFEEVISASNAAIADLSAAWATIGVPEDEQKAEVTKLRDVIFACFDQRVAQEKQRVEDLRAEIASGLSAIEAVGAELVDEDPGAPLQDDGSSPLLARRDAVVARLDELNAAKREWTEKLSQRVDKLQTLHETLSEPVPATFDACGELSQARLAAFDGHIVAAEKETANRHKAIAQVVGEIVAFWEELEEGARTELDRMVEEHAAEPRGIGVRADTVAALSSRAQELQAEKDERLDKVRSLGAAITVLWEELRIDDEERNAFLGQHQGLGMKTLRACEEELERMRGLKQERMSELVAEARARVAELWDELHAGPEERASVPEMQPGDDEALTEEVFEALQRKVASLTEKVGRFRPLLKQIKRREELLDEKVTYEALLADPNRLLSRRRGAALMEEAKLANRVTKKLPKLTEALKKKVRAWEAEEGNSELWINGERFLEHVRQQEEAAAAAKAQKSNAKAAAKKKRQKEEIEHGSRPRARRTTMMKSKSLKRGAKRPAGAHGAKKEQRNPNVVGLSR
jgi:protein regulator of cytokinesis 1